MILRGTMLPADGVHAFGGEFDNRTQLVATFSGGTTANGYNSCNRDATIDTVLLQSMILLIRGFSQRSKERRILITVINYRY